MTKLLKYFSSLIVFCALNITSLAANYEVFELPYGTAYRQVVNTSGGWYLESEEWRTTSLPGGEIFMHAYKKVYLSPSLQQQYGILYTKHEATVYYTNRVVEVIQAYDLQNQPIGDPSINTSWTGLVQPIPFSSTGTNQEWSLGSVTVTSHSTGYYYVSKDGGYNFIGTSQDKIMNEEQLSTLATIYSAPGLGGSYAIALVGNFIPWDEYIVGAKRIYQLNKYKPFVYANHRHNLLKWSGVTEAWASNYHSHHVFPDMFSSHFSNIGINHNFPKYLQWWEKGDHLSNAQQYNQAWSAWFAPYLAQGVLPTFNQTLAAGRSIMAQFGQVAPF